MSEMFLTVEEFAKELKVSSQTIRRWLKTGKIKGIRLGDKPESRWRIPMKELLRIHADVFENN